MSNVFYKAEHHINDVLNTATGFLQLELPVSEEQVVQGLIETYSTATNLLHWHVVGTNCGCGEHE